MNRNECTPSARRPPPAASGGKGRKSREAQDPLAAVGAGRGAAAVGRSSRQRGAGARRRAAAKRRRLELALAYCAPLSARTVGERRVPCDVVRVVRACGVGVGAWRRRSVMGRRPATLAVLVLAVAAAAACPTGCDCSKAQNLRCHGGGLREVPPLPPDLRVLNLADNNISTLHRASLQPAQRLQDLDLSGNPLEAVGSGAFGALPDLRRLALSRCRLRRLPAHALRSLEQLHQLLLDGNELNELEPEALAPLRTLLFLRLDGNRLRRVPAHALRHLANLQILDLSGNAISELDEESLPALPALRLLMLRNNRITHVDERAFAPVPALTSLGLDRNLLTELPTAISRLSRLEKLWLSNNRIEVVEQGVLAACSRLARLDLCNNPLQRMHPRSLHNLTALHTLLLSESKLEAVPTPVGCSRLRSLQVNRARLQELPTNLCRHVPALQSLDVKSNRLSRVPDLGDCNELEVLDLSWNRIASLEGRPLRGLSRLLDLLLAHNELHVLPRDAFVDTPRLQRLDLESNKIEHIDGEAFVSVSGLNNLNLGANRFPWLPAGGLQRLRHLKVHNNQQLRTFHPPEVFPHIESLVLSYAYHCCEFMPPENERYEAADAGGRGFRNVVVVLPDVDVAGWVNYSDSWIRHGGNLTVIESIRTSAIPVAGLGSHRRVRCLPQPGPFMPCVDLFDWWTLRCGVWVVFLLALLGNGTVVLVLVLSRSRMDVPRFLVANLAAADLCMGLYLGFLAVVDAGTLGEFRAHALAWQLSAGCRLAGFLAVLSSELSVYTLAVITLERNYAITHAMHLNKRLSLRHAAAVMGGGWAFALTAATLPLLGVSDYRKFAICLPFETDSPFALGYVTLLLALNGLAFVVLLGCYLRMYCAIRGSQAWNSNDSRIAKRMALLVFTDFLCWAPVAVSALSAAFGARLVTLEQAKVLTVFVLPLNSCCNPFLYAILTKQFKKDCALVCKQIEESRVTRGIGRCRHSSNFSNRQTPANTDSLVERSSRAHRASCACRRLLPPPPPPPLPPPPVQPPPLHRLRNFLMQCGSSCTCNSTTRGAITETGRATGVGGRAANGAGGTGGRAGSMSSSVEFSSSRSDSWRACGGRPPPPRRAASWLVARKTSQDSNLSSSRNDSSGSNATASTGTWRTSRSGGSAVGGAGVGVTANAGAVRPRLTRQPAVLGEEPPSPAREGARLHTIPSAAEPEPPSDEAAAALR